MADRYKLQRQTKAKHELLRTYLRAWARVLSPKGKTGGPDTLLYVDGFAFTGMYTSDEDGGEGGPGSPLIAMECFTGDPEPAARGVFVFIEENKEYADELERNLAAWPHRRNQDEYKVRVGDFASGIEKPLAWAEERARQHNVIPMFVFVDPYGVEGHSMDIVRRILRLPKAEVFINLMWVRTALNLHNPGAHDSELFTTLFGTEAWRPLLELRGEDLRRAFLDLYLERVRAPDGAEAGFARSFEMCGSDGAVVFWMVFCTNSSKGFEKMKEAMWKVDPGGAFQYKDTTHPGQVVLFQPKPPAGLLQRLLLEHFRGRAGVAVAEVEDFVGVQTIFRREHLRDHALKPLENVGRIAVHRPDGTPRGSYPAHRVTLDFP